MSVIKFNPQQQEQIAAFLEAIPQIGTMDAEALKHYRQETERTIAALDELEPRSQTSEAYELWAELHEDLEDVLDELLDRLEELGLE